MIDKKQVDALKKEIDDQIDIVREANDVILEKENQLIDLVLSCPEIMNESKWDMNNEQSLVSNVTRHKQLSDLLQKDYHSRLEGKNMQVCFNDNDIEILFYQQDALHDYVKKMNLQINADDIREQIKHLESSISYDQNKLKELTQRLKDIESIT